MSSPATNAATPTDYPTLPPPWNDLSPSPPWNDLSPPPPPPPAGSGGSHRALAVGLVIFGLFAMLIAFCVGCHKKKKRQEDLENKQRSENDALPKDDKPTKLPKLTTRPAVVSNPQLLQVRTSHAPSSTNTSLGSEKPLPPSSGIALLYSPRNFSCKELERATDRFSKENLLGKGGFGNVYKGVLPDDGGVIAIKQLKSGSQQGECEFQTEVKIISRIHHKHLVTLVGFCIDGAERMLVYDFVPNKTLDFHLHGKERPTMNWPTRLKIALGSAKGLAYLHEGCQPKIIHRDIKAANILLDVNFEPKVADFGLAKSLLETDTHVSTAGKGTFGYMDPEYVNSRKLTEKSDVYSYGVVLLELITGQKALDETKSLVEWARPLLKEAFKTGNFDGLVDPGLQNYDTIEMTRMVGCADACVRHSAEFRPRMSQIIQALEGTISVDDFHEGRPPGQSRDYDSSLRKKFIKMVENQEQDTSEYSRPSSESGLHPSASSKEGKQTTEEMELQKTKNDVARV